MALLKISAYAALYITAGLEVASPCQPEHCWILSPSAPTAWLHPILIPGEVASLQQAAHDLGGRTGCSCQPELCAWAKDLQCSNWFPVCVLWGLMLSVMSKEGSCVSLMEFSNAPHPRKGSWTALWSFEQPGLVESVHSHGRGVELDVLYSSLLSQTTTGWSWGGVGQAETFCPVVITLWASLL